tara:strand:- start:76 stop:573 length:498 start_codon:yes stop_codon:yes gene_type:complete
MQLEENKNAMLISTMSEIQDREAIANALSTVLANSYALYLKTQFYHWNITGKNFMSLHTLFEEQYTELALAIDEIAERIRALGYFSPGTFKSFMNTSDIKEDESVPTSSTMLQNLIDASEICIRSCMEAKELCEDKDDVTEDLMIARINVLQKNSWMLRSVLVEC